MAPTSTIPRRLLERAARSLTVNSVQHAFVAGDAAAALQGARVKSDTVEIVFSIDETNKIIDALNEGGFLTLKDRPLKWSDMAKANNRAFRLEVKHPDFPGKLRLSTSTVAIPEVNDSYMANDVFQGSDWDVETKVLRVGHVPFPTQSLSSILHSDKTSLERLSRFGEMMTTIKPVNTEILRKALAANPELFNKSYFVETTNQITSRMQAVETFERQPQPAIDSNPGL